MAQTSTTATAAPAPATTTMTAPPAAAHSPTKTVTWLQRRGAFYAFWGFVSLCWLTALVVDVLVTPGDDWLRRQGGDNGAGAGSSSIGWFRVGGENDDFLNCCETEVPNSQWCSDFAAFTVVQTAASIHVSVAAVLLLMATCRRRPCRWGMGSGAFFMMYAVLQAGGGGLVISAGLKLEEALAADSRSSEVDWRPGLPSSSSSSSPSPSAVGIEYGTTLVSALCCGILGFNASLVLFSLCRRREDLPPEAGALLLLLLPCGCFGRRSRKADGRSRRSPATSKDFVRTTCQSRSAVPLASATAAAPVRGAAATIFLGSARPYRSAAQSYPRAGSNVDEACHDTAETKFGATRGL